MKTYNWEEIINKLMENGDLIFEDIDNGFKLKYDNNCVNFYYKDGTKASRYGIDLTRKFKLVEQPISFMEAVNSGKRIRVEHKIMNVIKEAMLFADDELIIAVDNIKSGKYLPIVELVSILSRICNNDLFKDIINNGKWYMEEE